jgi:hypothetical protein
VAAREEFGDLQLIEADGVAVLVEVVLGMSSRLVWQMLQVTMRRGPFVRVEVPLD